MQARFDLTRRFGGFTLLEVIVAITIATMVIIATRELAEQLANGARSLHRQSENAVRDLAADALLRSLVGQIEPRRDSAGFEGALFAGNGTAADFPTWCRTAGGWEERCHVRLQLSPASLGTVVLQASSPAFGTIDLDSLANPSGLRYLLDAGGGGRWITTWSPSVNAPLAIAIVTATDTILLRIGARG